MSQKKTQLENLKDTLVTWIMTIGVNAKAIWGHDIDEVSNDDTDKVLIADTEENSVLYSNTLNSGWSGTRVVTGNANELIASDTPGSHFYEDDFTLTSEASNDRVFSARGKIGAVQYMQMIFNKSGQTAHYATVDLATGEISNDSGTATMMQAVVDGEYCTLKIQASIGSGSGKVYIYAKEIPGSTSFTGDDATPSIYVDQIGVVNGTIADNTKPADSTGAAIVKTTKVAVQDYYTAKHAAGLVLQTDGDWKVASEVNGDLMDESPPNVNAMRRAGLYKAVTARTWGPLVEGVAVYANNDTGNYFELFTFYGTLSEVTILEMSIEQPADTQAVPLLVKGHVDSLTSNSKICKVGSYQSSTNFASLDPAANTSSNDIVLTVGTDLQQSNVRYKFTVEYAFEQVEY